MNDKRFAEIKALAVTTTPGPWYWENNVKCIGVRLYTPKCGHSLVMDFVRQGMQSAQPRFSDRCGQPLGGVMIDAMRLDLDTHPDAQLIAAAPELLTEVIFLRAEVERLSDSWISVEDRLPEPNPDYPAVSIDVLATDGKKCFMAYYVFAHQHWFGVDTLIPSGIIYWKPMILPKVKQTEPVIRYFCMCCWKKGMTGNDLITHLACEHNVQINEIPEGDIDTCLHVAGVFLERRIFKCGGVTIEESILYPVGGEVAK